MNRTEPRTIRDCLRSLGLILPVLILLAIGDSPAFAENIIFTIDPSMSTISFSGSNPIYGSLFPQFPGSLTTPVSGHFLVSFDPLSNAPATIQLLGTNNGNPNSGYFQLASTNLGLPGAYPGLSTSTPEPANLAGATAGGNVQLAYRNMVWDFSSPTINGASGAFPATTTSFYLSHGELDTFRSFATPNTNSYPQAGTTGTLTAGGWTLAQTSPGTGDWTLSIGASYTSTDFGSLLSSGTMTGNFVSTAHFGAANLATVPQPSGAPVEAQVLGGSGATGGVTADFNQNSSGGVLSVQQVPNNTALTTTELDSLSANPLFVASTSSLSANPQIWDAQYGGSLNGGTATLVFHYDPSLLPPGTDQSMLGIWHFSSLRGQWEFGGTVNTADDTITYVTDGFSPFELGLAVPEPSSIALMGIATIGLIVAARRRIAKRTG